ncbi:uncharacterized protein LOC131256201 isoform X1 [Magnolia sinica]|uniref:uncharacterized protein LOC131256201 isoform X1 n=1 Tax=Magnolia sinica TaxID=86752 RepID=UPI002659106A|nr:uncharacterized protein LOC131256201 isoform X1 [Magnolia sinica]
MFLSVSVYPLKFHFVLNSMGVLYTEMFLVSNNMNNSTMRKSLLIGASIEVLWRKKRRKKKNRWSKRNWRQAFNLWTVFRALPLVWRPLMSSTSGSNKGRSLRNLCIRDDLDNITLDRMS